MEIKTVENKSDLLKIKRFGDVDTNSPFFDSFRRVYSPYYDNWLESKRDDPVFVVESGCDILAFLKLKKEGIEEDYSDIVPLLTPMKRLKISSLKVSPNNLGLSRKMMRLVLSEAISNKVDEIYGTVAIGTNYEKKLTEFLKKWGFQKHGQKLSHGVEEDVYVCPAHGIDPLEAFSIIEMKDNDGK